jgi:hypothetical protein
MMPSVLQRLEIDGIQLNRGTASFIWTLTRIHLVILYIPYNSAWRFCLPL